jgi:hypothetical protein
MALGCGLNSVRGNRGENNENEPLVRQKQIKEKKCSQQDFLQVFFRLSLKMSEVWWVTQHNERFNIT